MLLNGTQTGMSYLLIIEEAHRLPMPTLKHLKGFFELECGFKKLPGIVLIGQPELRQKLSERNHEVREVVQRCEVVELAPLDNQLEEYLKFKFHRAGKPLTDAVDQSGIEGIRAKLTFNVSPSPPGGRGARGEGRSISLLYPSENR